MRSPEVVAVRPLRGSKSVIGSITTPMRAPS
jgi:hypothetical protein